MSRRQFGSQSESPVGTSRDRLLVADVVRYLIGLAKLHEDEKTGNHELSEGLRSVARALRPYSAYTAVDLTDVISKNVPPTAIIPTTTNNSKPVLPRDLEYISQDELERILDDGQYTKKQLAEVGCQRFGISRSKLERLRKSEACDSIRAALDHERSLDAISREALKGGMARSA